MAKTSELSPFFTYKNLRTRFRTSGLIIYLKSCAADLHSNYFLHYFRIRIVIKYIKIFIFFSKLESINSITRRMHTKEAELKTEANGDKK